MAATMLSALFDRVHATSTASVMSATATPAVTSDISDLLGLFVTAWSATDTALRPSATMPGIEPYGNTTNYTDDSTDDCMSIFCFLFSEITPWTIGFIIIGIIILVILVYCLVTCVRECIRLSRRQVRATRDDEIEMEGRGFSKAQQERLKREKKQMEKRIKEMERKQALVPAARK